MAKIYMSQLSVITSDTAIASDEMAGKADIGSPEVGTLFERRGNGSSVILVT
jgi:hypothetical protein